MLLPKFTRILMLVGFSTSVCDNLLSPGMKTNQSKHFFLLIFQAILLRMPNPNLCSAESVLNLVELQAIKDLMNYVA